MKKFFLLLTAGALMLSSCKEEPMLTLSQAGANPTAAGEVLTVDVTTNCEWKATCSDNTITINPASGTGNATVSITVPENPVSTPKTYQVVFTGTNETGMVSANYDINQLSAEASVLTTFPEDLKPNGYAITFKVKLTATNDWSATISNGATVEPASGTYGEYDLTVSIPENGTNAAVSHVLSIALAGDSASEEITLEQPAISTLDYADVTYKVKWMADGRLWMVENLRYVPEGKTPSADPTDNSGIWYPNYLTSEAKTAADSVAKYGLLYNFEAIWGTAPTTKDVVESVEGKQGICPEGWHVPTKAEADSLVNAYWDADQKGALISTLEEAGFSTLFGGFVQQNTSIAVGKYQNVLRGYVLTSTSATFKDNGDKGISSYNSGLILTVNKSFQKMSVANASNFGGASVRCVKNK